MGSATTARMKSETTWTIAARRMVAVSKLDEKNTSGTSNKCGWGCKERGGLVAVK